MGVGAESSLTVVRERESFEVQYSLGGFLAGYSHTHRAVCKVARAARRGPSDCCPTAINGCWVLSILR
jgi:hypothetical protein